MNCDKFEKLFTQEDETELLEHIKVCPECRQKYEQFNKISELVKETKPLFLKEKRMKKNLAISLVAGVTFFILSGFVVMSWLPSYNYNQAIASEIYPTDEYGLVDFTR